MIWRKQKRPDSREVQRYRSVVLRDAFELVKIANLAERECADDDPSQDSTTSRNLRHARSVVVAERALTKHILLACDHGMTPVHFGSEIIKTTVVRTVVGELALFALQRSVREAERQRRIRDRE